MAQDPREASFKELIQEWRQHYKWGVLAAIAVIGIWLGIFINSCGISFVGEVRLIPTKGDTKVIAEVLRFDQRMWINQGITAIQPKIVVRRNVISVQLRGSTIESLNSQLNVLAQNAQDIYKHVFGYTETLSLIERDISDVIEALSMASDDIRPLLSLRYVTLIQAKQDLQEQSGTLLVLGSTYYRSGLFSLRGAGFSGFVALMALVGVPLLPRLLWE